MLNHVTYSKSKTYKPDNVKYDSQHKSGTHAINEIKNSKIVACFITKNHQHFISVCG